MERRPDEALTDSFALGWEVLASGPGRCTCVAKITFSTAERLISKNFTNLAIKYTTRQKRQKAHFSGCPAAIQSIFTFLYQFFFIFFFRHSTKFATGTQKEKKKKTAPRALITKYLQRDDHCERKRPPDYSRTDRHMFLIRAAKNKTTSPHLFFFSLRRKKS